jgi:hypothetical protein
MTNTMETKIEFFDMSNWDENNNAVEIIDYNFCGIKFLPRIGENVYLSKSNKHYVVSNIQHVFKSLSETETQHVIKINIKHQ